MLAMLLTACGGGGGGDGGPFAIGGTVSGLSGAGLVLSRNGVESLSVPAAGRFTFVDRVARGAAYAVTVAAQPAGQTCVVRNGNGTAEGTVDDIGVTCSSAAPPPPPPVGSYTVGGGVTGLTGSGLVLKNNGLNDLAITANGPFTFTTSVADGGGYAVTVATPPSGQRCDVSDGTGTVAGANVTAVRVSCVDSAPPPPPPASYTVGGSISGYTGRGLVLQLNGGDGITLVAGATAFTFPTAVASGASYTVSIAVPAFGQDCTLANATGNVGGANVNNVAVTCVAVAPLTSLGTLPANNAIGVARDVVPRLTFSAPVEPATVNGVSVPFFAELAVGALSESASYGFDGTSLNVTPVRKLLPLTTYDLLVTTSVLGTRGQRLADAVPMSFTTVDGVWRSRSTLDTASDRTDVQIAFNRRGDAVAVVKTSSGYVSYHYSADTAQWTGPMALAITSFTVTSGTDRDPSQLALDEAGNAMAVTISRDVRPSVVMASRYNAARGAWETPQPVPKSDTAATADSPTVAAKGTPGSFVVAWERSGSSRGIDAAELSPSLTFVRNIHDNADPAASISELRVTVGQRTSSFNGTVEPVLMFTWMQGASNEELWARRYDGGFEATEPAAVISQTGAGTSSNHQVALDTLGRAYVVWAQSAGVRLRRYVIDDSGNGRWGRIETVGDPAVGAGNPSIVTNRSDLGGADVVWLSWTTGSIPNNRLWAAKIEANAGVPSTPVQLNADADPVYDRSTLGVDRAGNAMALWITYSSDVNALTFRRYNAQTNAWEGISNLSRNYAQILSGGIGLGVGASGDAVAGWIEDDDAGNTTLRVGHFR